MSENLNKISKLIESLGNVESALKEEKNILEFVLENTTDGYWDWDVTTNYEYLGPRFKKQLGYEVDEMGNNPESWQKICNKEDLGKMFGIVETKVFTGETDNFKEKLRFNHKDGFEVTILCRGMVVKRSEDGIPLRIIGTHTIID